MESDVPAPQAEECLLLLPRYHRRRDDILAKGSLIVKMLENKLHEYLLA